MSQGFLRQVYIKIDFGVNLDCRVCSKNKSTKGIGRKIWVLGFNDNSSFVFHSLSFGCCPPYGVEVHFRGKKFSKLHLQIDWLLSAPGLWPWLLVSESNSPWLFLVFFPVWLINDDYAAESWSYAMNIVLASVRSIMPIMPSCHYAQQVKLTINIACLLSPPGISLLLQDSALLKGSWDWGRTEQVVVW